MRFFTNTRSASATTDPRNHPAQPRRLAPSIRIGIPALAVMAVALLTATTFGYAVWAKSGKTSAAPLATVRRALADTEDPVLSNVRNGKLGSRPRSADASNRPSGNPSAIAVSPATTPTASDNDYTRINLAVHNIAQGGTITLTGTFDWTEANAAASWALGSDGVSGTADDYSILIPANLNGVTLTATTLNSATIQGPGDLAAVNLEGVLLFDGTGVNHGWTISNIRFLDFDLAIAMFADALGDFDNTHITNNYIRVATDLNATVAPADVNQNIGIYFSFGQNQLISGNTIDIPGDGVSDLVNGLNATDVGMQCDAGSTNSSEGLQIANNVIHVLHAQSASPESLIGYWENSNVSASNITVHDNLFIDQGVGNDPTLNRQRGFRVTSHSSATTTVAYINNTVRGANIGIEWPLGPDFTGMLPVKLTSNTVTANATGIIVRSHGSANLSFNRIANNSVTGLNNVDGTVTAENNWWGCNAGPGVTGCDSVTGTVDFNPWIVLGISASPTSIGSGGTSNITADMTHNSDGVVPSLTTFMPQLLVQFSATEGTMNPTSGLLINGQATSVFTSNSSNNGSASATVDNQTVTVPFTVTAPTFAINDVTMAEGDAGTTSFVFTVTKTGTTGLSSDVTFATQDGTATVADNDYQANSGTLTFLAGDTTKQITVLVNGDTTIEGDETFLVNLTGATNGTISDNQGTGTITNDDTTPQVMSIGDAKVFEGDSGTRNLAFTVTLAPGANRAGQNVAPAISVHYHTSDGTAKASDNDYVPVADGVAVFNSPPAPSGLPTATINIVVNGDTRKEPNEFLFVTIDQPQGATIGRSRGAGIIVDDDRAYVGDLDHDRKADFTVFRASDSNWYTSESSNGNSIYLHFGIPTDHPVPGDYDGDGQMDYAVRRPGTTNQWFYQFSSDFSGHELDFGIDSDLSVQADYDGDGKTDIAVFRDGTWYIHRSSDNVTTAESFGSAGDIPIPGDFDGDGKADLTVFRSGIWYTLRSSDGTMVSQPFGQAGDKPVAGDFDGDGRFDYAVYRNGSWYILQSLSGQVRSVNFGLAGDTPVVADYDGDGTSDVAVFRPSEGNWYVLRSSDDAFVSLHWGQNGDIPIPAAYLP